MPKTGTVRKWEAARGFGFIRGPGEGADVFFHLRDWRGPTPPREGVWVDYEEIHVGGKGPRAMAVRPKDAANVQRRAAPAAFDGHRNATPAARSRGSHVRTPLRHAPRAPAASAASGALWWWPALVLWLGGLAAGSALQRLPVWVLGALVAINVVTFFVYAWDKSAAARGGWRTREDTLHLLSLAGGWPAARLAQQSLRHKSSKASFQSVYLLTVLLHCAALGAWVLWLAQRIAY